MISYLGSINPWLFQFADKFSPLVQCESQAFSPKRGENAVFKPERFRLEEVWFYVF